MTKARVISHAPVLKVSVTEDIIDRAVKANSASCALATAIKEQYPQYTHVAVDLQTVRISDADKGLRYIYLTPRISQSAIVLFDQGVKHRAYTVTIRGAHIVSTYKKDPDLPLARKRTALGPRRVLNPEKGYVPDTIGGLPVKRHIGSNQRTFGLRALSGNLEPQIPTSN